MHHIHESPKNMAVPLMVLAVLSFVGGFMNVPEALMGSSWLQDYLSPVFAPSANILSHHHLDHSTEYMLMAIVIGFTAVVIFMAYSMYVKKQQLPAEDEKLAGVGKLLYHKYYVDEIYDSLVVKPVHWFGKIGDTVIERLTINKAFILFYVSGKVREYFEQIIHGYF